MAHTRNEEFLKDEEDGFKQGIKFISLKTNDNFVSVLQDKFIEKLELMGEDRGAKWVKGICISMKCLKRLARGCATEN